MAMRTNSDFFDSLSIEKDLADDECPICYEVLTDPIQTECRHCFCLECAKTWFDSAHTCPSCRNPLYEAPEDYQDSDEDDAEDGIDGYVAQVPDHRSPTVRDFRVLPSSDNPLNYNTSSLVEFPHGSFEIDVKDAVFRETLVDLCFGKGDGGGDMSQIWDVEPDWNGPTLITRVHLQSQALATIIRMFPKRIVVVWDDIASTTEACWDDWVDVGRYLLDRLLDLWERQPEQSARNLQQSLRRGWLDRLADGDRLMPRLAGQARSSWGSFEETVDRLFVRVIVFAQETAGRYAQTLRDSRHFSDTTEMVEDEEADPEDGSFDVEESIDDIFDDLIDNNFYQDTADSEDAATPEDVPDAYIVQTAVSRSSSAAAAASTHPPLSEDAERLLRHITTQLKQCIIAGEVACYIMMARALVIKAAEYERGRDGFNDFYRGLQPGPFSFDLCNEMWPFTEPIKTECGHSFCMQCAKEWFRSANTCPSCRTPPFFQKPDDWEDSDEEQLEDESDEEEEEESQADEEDDEHDLPRTFQVVLDVGGPLYYGEWFTAQTLGPEDFEIDMEDDVFRETLVELCAPSIDFDEYWRGKPDWDGPTLITRLHLRSQTIAAIVRLTPDPDDARAAHLDFREAMCWSGWAEVTRYLLAKLSELWEHQPEQSARGLLRSLHHGWIQHLEAKGLSMPQYDARIPYQSPGGSVSGAVSRLMTRVILFAQEAARRYSSVRETSRLAEYVAESNEEDRVWDHQSASDEDDIDEWASDEEDQLDTFNDTINPDAEISHHAHDHSNTVTDAS